jgi:dTDP-4-amino-4,6-dideoxygalactose transaminase
MSLADELAITGGVRVRNLKRKPWPKWPQPNQQEWAERIEPALREIYMSGVEGLPQPAAKELGRRFAEYCGTPYARFLPHGTDAIAAALAATLDLDGWGDGGEVILPNYTFIATASAALDRRCTLAFVDINPVTFTMEPKALAAAIVPGKTRAVLPVHIAGHPADMAAITAIAARHNLMVVEDCAQAHGAVCDGKMVGSIGHTGAFSFQSTKNLTCGEGGMVTASDPEIDARVVGFMDVGRDPEAGRWEYPQLGWNYRTSEYLAALLTVRLQDLEEQTRHRDHMARFLSQRLAQISGVTPPWHAPWCTRHAYHLYSILIDVGQFGGRSRDEIVEALCGEGIPCMAGYTIPLSETQALKRLRDKYPNTIRVLPCPSVEHVCNHTIWLAQQMLLAGEEDMLDIVDAVSKVQRAFSRGR